MEFDSRVVDCFKENCFKKIVLKFIIDLYIDRHLDPRHSPDLTAVGSAPACPITES